MKTTDIVPLGFSDLTDDEAFIVSVFRHWQSIGSTCAAAEVSLKRLLRNDRLYDGLTPLFDLFETLPEHHKRKSKNESAVLKPVEEALLNELGTVRSGQKRCVTMFQGVLDTTDTKIRPASDIPRTGYDRLVETVDRNAFAVLKTLYPGFLERV